MRLDRTGKAEEEETAQQKTGKAIHYIRDWETLESACERHKQECKDDHQKADAPCDRLVNETAYIETIRIILIKLISTRASGELLGETKLALMITMHPDSIRTENREAARDDAPREQEVLPAMCTAIGPDS